MSEEKSSSSLRLLTRVTNGAIAGLAGTVMIYPLDFAKTRIQSQTRAVPGHTGSERYKNLLERARALVHCLGVNLVFVMPEKAIKLSANDHLRHLMGSNGHDSLPLAKELVAGCSAGMLQVIVTTPMELLKIQMQMASQNNGAINQNQQSALKIAYQSIKNSGISSLYRGLASTLLRDVSFGAIYFPTFAYLNSLGVNKDYNAVPFYHTFASGLAAGSLAAFSVTPFDVIKTRIQYISNDPNKLKVDGIIDCAIKTAKNDSLRAFFKGAVPRVCVVAPLFGIAQTVYFFNVAQYLFGPVKS